ncbi:hypothetical protein DXG03_002253 [Asterophora parasitica]|uniref:Uncharacterized protein n=1 Tax=Asterophora parasitica TaxID=117018 RepID=A0A9P7G4J9_9AGAR|nr:hypothetical protein DXG03_002253 [Asterophora parasitica]
MIQCFLGATLRSVVIKFDEEESYMAHLFSSITRLCPELEDFQIQSVLEEPSLAYTAALSNLVSGLPKLRVLAITSWQPSEELVAHLGSLPTLEEWAYFELPDYPHPERLRSLDAFVNALLTHPSAKSLSTLAITETPTPDVTTNHHNAESVAFFLFRKFFKLPAIESLELTVPILSSLDDSWLEEASSAWPRLSTLELRGEGPPMMTLQGLVPLLKNCAHLEHLRVSAVWKPFDTTGLRNCSNFKIQEMRIGNLVVAKPVVAVFRCLLLLFPVINEVVNQAPGASEDRRWMRLKTLIEESRGTNTGDEEDGGGEATD